MTLQSPLFSKRQTGIALSTYLLVIGIALLLGVGLGWLSQPQNGSVQSATVLPESRPLAAFELNGSQHASLSPADLQGSWTWVFFGFTHCPDVCPGTLSNLRDSLPLIDGDKPKVLFISLDPARDTIPKLKAYTEWFNPEFMAATGSEAELSKAAKSMGIAWSKVTDPNSSNYQINHTSWVILLNPSAQIQAWFSPPHLPQTMAHDFMVIRDNHHHTNLKEAVQ